MEKKTIIVIALASVVLGGFITILGENSHVEELAVLYLLPFVPSVVVLAISALVARIRKRHISIEGRARRTLISVSVFHTMPIAFMVYALWPRYYDKADAIEDVDFFVKTLEDVHPYLYDRVSRNEFADSVESLKRRLTGRVDENELFKDLSRLGALIQDGHTGNGYSYFMRRGNMLLRMIFPYKLRVEDDRIYILGNFSYRDDVPAGSEILRINGLTGRDFIDQMSKLLSYETIPYRNTLIANPMFIAIWNDFKDYDLDIRLAGSGEIRTVRTYGGLYARIQFIGSMTETGQPYEFKVLADTIGYLGFYRFADLERFTGFLEGAFKTMKSMGIPHLIIDVRENGGGNSSLGDELMQYISPKAFRMFDRIQIKVSQGVLSRHRDWIDSTKQQVGILYDIPELPLTPLRPNPFRFTGDCILLTGRRTFSSAACFASAFRCSEVGMIIGAETGGITVCYGDVYDFTLPHSGFGFGVSWKKFTNACGLDDRRGFLPDYPIESAFSEEQEGRDSVLAFAVAMTGRKIPRHGSAAF